MSHSAWIWNDWHFGIYECRCDCGRFLSKPEPVMQMDWVGGGVIAVRGICKKHGQVETKHFSVYDIEDVA